MYASSTQHCIAQIKLQKTLFNSAAASTGLPHDVGFHLVSVEAAAQKAVSSKFSSSYSRRVSSRVRADRADVPACIKCTQIASGQTRLSLIKRCCPFTCTTPVFGMGFECACADVRI